MTAVLELYTRVAKVLAYRAYRGELGKQIKAAYDCEVGISQRPMVIEGEVQTQTFIPENHEGMIYVVNIRLTLRRIAKNQRIWGD